MLSEDSDYFENKNVKKNRHSTTKVAIAVNIARNTGDKSLLIKIKKGKKLTNEDLRQLQDGSKFAKDETYDPIAEELDLLRLKYKNNAYNALPIEPKVKEKRCSKCVCPRKMIISFRSRIKMQWDIFVLILALYNSIMIPLDEAFYPWWR